MQSKRRISVRPVTAALALMATAVAGAATPTVLAQTDVWNQSAPRAEPIQAPASSVVARAGNHASLADMVEAVGPSVVQIDATGETRAVRTPFGLMRQPGRKAVGSGFIVDKSGLVITNNHVVEGVDKVEVTLSDGKAHTARVLGRDPKTDLAILRIDGAANLRPIEWGDSDSIRVGDSVFAVGSPFGLGNTVTSGIVSARGREIGAGPYDDFLQVDAAINSGNSGGPLFDSYGRVVGVNTAMFSPSGGNVGIGFAIPSSLAQKIARQIATAGSVERGYVGVGLQELNEGIAAALGLDEAKGALIAQIEPGSPAASSGLQRGDVVRGFGGREVEDSRDFARFVGDSKIGSTIPLTVLRDGRQVSIRLRIGEERSAG